MAAVEGTLDLMAMPSQELEVQVFFVGGGGGGLDQKPIEHTYIYLTKTV